MVLETKAGTRFTVDDCIAKIISQFQWRDDKRDKRNYIYTSVGSRKIYLHRLVFGLLGKINIDHRDRCTENNLINNLRTASHSENVANSVKRAKPKTGYRGIYKHRARWVAGAQYMGKSYKTHGLLTAEAAAREYDRMAIRFWGEFATLNFPVKKELK